MSTSVLAQIVHQVAISLDQETVVIKLICIDAYAAHVLFDDVQERLNSGQGLRLDVRAVPVDEGRAS